MTLELVLGIIAILLASFALTESLVESRTQQLRVWAVGGWGCVVIWIVIAIITFLE